MTISQLSRSVSSDLKLSSSKTLHWEWKTTPSTVRDRPPQTTILEPLQQILKRLYDMQGQINSLQDKHSENPASKPPINAEEGEVSEDNPTEHTFHEASSVSSHNRDRSPSPINEQLMKI